MYSPFTDPSVAPQDKGTEFVRWITGYFSHTIPHTPGIRASDIVNDLEQRKTTARTPFTPDELDFVMFNPPADVPTGGEDILSSAASIKHGLPALYLETALRGARWPHVELRHIWGDASFWEACVAGVEFGRLVHEDKKAAERKIGRPASAVRWIAANHFVRLLS